jgi:hypothetical protein
VAHALHIFMRVAALHTLFLLFLKPPVGGQ